MNIIEVIIEAREPATLAAFYRDALGISDAPGDGALPAGAAAVQAGATRLVFAPAEAGAAADGPPVYHLAFNIPENQLDAAHAWLRERVALLTYEGREVVPFAAWNAHALYFLDPAGNVLECIARHNLSNASSEPFGPHSLLEVSEIGTPTRDRPAFLRRLRDELGIALWRGDDDTFGAVGDEHGLFIVVPPGHPWLPTDIPARPHPIALTLRAEGPPRRAAFDDPPLTVSCVRSLP